eukprot:358639-Chlamydomonas_euryale.AAC.5
MIDKQEGMTPYMGFFIESSSKVPWLHALVATNAPVVLAARNRRRRAPNHSYPSGPESEMAAARRPQRQAWPSRHRKPQPKGRGTAARHRCARSGGCRNGCYARRLLHMIMTTKCTCSALSKVPLARGAS